jgi:prephenate dehydratase
MNKSGPNTPLQIAIQGVKASFHDVAAKKVFPKQEIHEIECASFPILCQSLSKGQADFAMMAIENTIAGSILPNYALLQSYGFKILGETYLRIEMSIMALKGQTLSDIRKVQSHPMAILQCQEFLATLPNIQIVEASDTAESALEIAKRGLTGHAAIASKLAAETYGLEVLRENIETDRSNYTRFLTLCRSEDYKRPAGSNKASLRFETKHEPGSLAKVLTLFSQHQLNMTKIQSVPILGKPYQYGFHVDVEWDSDAQYDKALVALQTETINLIHFGEYPRGEKPTS